MQLPGKTLLILTVSNDQTTHKIIKHLNVDFLRINDDSTINITLSNLSNLNLEVDGRCLAAEEISQVWYRTGKILISKEHKIGQINFINKKEEAFFKEYLIYYMYNKFNILGSVTAEFSLNKLVVLAKARERGLTIPFSMATNHSDIHIEEKEKYIVKTVSNIAPFDYGGYRYGPVYSMLNESVYSYNSTSFFQNYIEKEFEIRSFYLNGSFYSMAIFSQNDQNTKIDFRNHDANKPNRNVPFKLPVEVERKLKDLMGDLNLNTGSIDLIYSKTGEFFFLEVNPSGQFDWLSVNCNYYLEKKIADYLNEQ